MRCALGTLALALAYSGTVFAQTPDAGGQLDGGSLQRELRELESTRAEFEQLTKELEQQRVELERHNQRAQADQNLRFVATGVVVLVVCVAGIAWLRRRSKQKIDAG